MSQFIGGRWRPGRGEAFASVDPTTGRSVWEGRATDARDVDEAVAAALAAAEAWASTPLERRADLLRAMTDRLRARRDELALMISREVGKPRWDALSEVDAMVGKAAIAIEAHAQRCATIRPAPGPVGGASDILAEAVFRPHGVAAVFGPFNFPGHLPHGHIAPALLAGNTVVFKPSERAPGVAELTVQLWAEAGAPHSVVNLVQGGRATGESLAAHPGIDAIYFTGSVNAGLALRRALADRPGVVLALEMGGNNPLLVWEPDDLDAAAALVIRSAYLTSGQRCTCARRLIVQAGTKGDAFLARLVLHIDGLRVGPHNLSPEPFMGPMISAAAADALRVAEAGMIADGGVALRRLDDVPPHGGTPWPTRAFVRPALIDVTAIPDRPDVEHFGPLLQVVRVADFDAAIAEANRTQFGLAAGLIGGTREQFGRFLARVRAGVVNWNRPLTNASSKLPFGGVGRSGNHRPSGYLAADYCAYPVATLATPRVSPIDGPLPGLEPPSPGTKTH
ncbi:MAG: succinylglutamate-semialdehyde dehydrogenase [Planctomycetota bacterium]|nr:succinylglutamate-semialdehyde dehydrogenase [Planctomycetota bacterium]